MSVMLTIGLISFNFRYTKSQQCETSAQQGKSFKIPPSTAETLGTLGSKWMSELMVHFLCRHSKLYFTRTL